MSRGVSGEARGVEEATSGSHCKLHGCQPLHVPVPALPAQFPHEGLHGNTHLALSWPRPRASTIAASLHSTTRMLYLQACHRDAHPNQEINGAESYQVETDQSITVNC